MAESERSARFAPVALLGIISTGLLAVAGSKPWFSAAVDYKATLGGTVPETTADMPLALACALVALASWGVVLVTGTRVRRIVVVLGLVAVLGVLACVVAAPFTLPDDVRAQLLAGSGDVPVDPTGWFFAAAVAAVVALVVLVVAWVLVPRWPTMSSRYDAPGRAGAASDLDPDTAASIDLWKALDEGRDPTAPGPL
ncbi:hypothetical protein ABIE44_000276 [Marmoricola sp. OAE513]|uniref:Trp biosynthesis-associated membrane protein n=1 Tax=Marmoricola sp. OAE513 TaxID=2817894 RepID=UPI001AE5B209